MLEATFTPTRRSNIDRVQRNFRRNSNHLPKDVAHAVRDVAKVKAPVGDEHYIDSDGNVHPGYLVESIATERITENHWRAYVGADYGVYLENGTRYMAAQPFWLPAVRFVARTTLRRGVRLWLK